MRSKSITPAAWFDAATAGDLAQLDRWKKQGLLAKRFQPGRVASVQVSGRPSVFDLVDKDGNTALHVAIRQGNLDYALSLLARHKWSPHANDKQETPLHLLAHFFHQDEALQHLGNVVSSLLEQGFSVHDKTKNENTPLCELCARVDGSPSKAEQYLFDAFLAAGARVSQDQMGSCIERKNLVFLHKLLELNAPACLVPLSRSVARNYSCVQQAILCWDQRDDSILTETGQSTIGLLIRHGANWEEAYVHSDGTVFTVEEILKLSRMPAKSFGLIINQEQARKIALQTPQACGVLRSRRV